jgi:hypothetical protein
MGFSAVEEAFEEGIAAVNGIPAGADAGHLEKCLGSQTAFVNIADFDVFSVGVFDAALHEVDHELDGFGGILNGSHRCLVKLLDGLQLAVRVIGLKTPEVLGIERLGSFAVIRFSLSMIFPFLPRSRMTGLFVYNIAQMFYKSRGKRVD